MAEILHQLYVASPIIYSVYSVQFTVFCTSQVVQDFFHEQYQI